MQTRKLKIGQYVEAVCKEFVQEGFGLSHIESSFLPYPVKPLTGFIWGVLPGERFVARVTRVKGNHFHGVLVKQKDLPNEWLGKDEEHFSENNFDHFYWALFRTNPNRVPSLCKNFTECGGCKLLHLSYEEGITYKEKWLLQLLAHKNITAQKNIRLLPSKLYHYRDHVQVHINKYKQRGFYAPFSYRTQSFPKNGCLLFDQKSFDDTFPQNLELVRCVRSRLNLDEKNIAQKVNTFELNSPEEKKSEFCYRVDFPPHSSTKISLPVTAFFQVNQNILPQWLERIEGWMKMLFQEKITANTKISVLELFSGSGFISRLLSYSINIDVVGIDMLKKEDVLRVKIENEMLGTPPLKDFAKNYICQNLLELHKIPPEQAKKIANKNFDVILMNPPRGGFAPDSLHFLFNTLLENYSSPVIYSSCNGATLARDLEAFASYGYQLQELIFMDFFPFTSHYESLSLLQK